jgi:ubiquinone/menaquinone biosynthesis C-methylase UbiE
MNHLPNYMFDNDSTAEYVRLDLMSKILDPQTRASLTSLGLREGWHCLELGGGNGSITEWLCQTVGPNGSVTSIDINPKLIKLIPARNITVKEADLRTADLPPGPFDLVMCRAMLHQIAEHAQTVLAKMAAAVKPGGCLFVCEPDFNLVRTTEPHAWSQTFDAILKWGQSQSVDWLIGRKLPAMITAMGLGYPQTETQVPTIRGATRDALYFQLFFETIYDRLLATGTIDAQTLDAANALLNNPDYWTQCWMLTSAWIRKPLA